MPFIKISSKWIIELNVKYKTIKPVEDNTGEYLGDLGFGDNFLDTTSKACCMKERHGIEY